ncbi:MAG: DUF456 domain-containing protein [Patescibacteria group bacterium]
MTIDIIFTILLCLGLLLTFIPTLPGVPMMFGTLFIYGLIDKFQTLEAWHLAVFGGLALLSILIDYSSGLIGAKLGGANKKSLLFGIIGLFVGLIVFPPFGAFIGLFLGVFVAELVQFKDKHKALKAASYSLAATVTGAAANILIAIACLVGFLIIII